LAIALEVLPADLGLFAAAEIGIAVSVARAVSMRVTNTSRILRLRFMEPPGPLAKGVGENCEAEQKSVEGGFP
jgi:hypothetical protein